MKYFTYALILIMFTACLGNRSGVRSFKGTLVDARGLDGCRWLIDMDSGNKKSIRLEPVNIDQFQLEFKEGMTIQFTYREINVMSVCMSGKPVELITVAAGKEK